MEEPAMQAAVDAVVKDPAGSVKNASTPAGREFYALGALTMTVQNPSLWPQLRDAGILNLYIELLVDEWTSPQIEASAPGWVFSLTGIINILVSLKKDERDHGAQEGNSQQYEIIRRAYPRIESTLWKVHENATTDKVIDVLALGMYHIARVPDLHPILYTPHTLGIIGHCWKHAKGVAARKVSCIVIRQFLATSHTPPSALDNFFSMTPFEDVIATLRKTFLNREITEDASQISVELLTADCFVNLDNQHAKGWVGEIMHGHVVALVEARAAAFKEDKMRWTVLDASAPFLNNVINASADPAEAFRELIVSYNFLQLGADALIAAAPRTDSYNSAWFRIFKMLIHAAHCEDTSCRIHSTPSFHSAMLERLTPIYVPTLDALDEFIVKEATKGLTSSSEDSNSDNNDVIKGKEPEDNERAALWQATLTWRALGAAIGINEEILRGNKPPRKDPNKVCWWANCQMKENEEDEPYKRCSGCHAVRYCSEKHQRADWKNGAHKDVCMILKNA